MGEAIVRLAKKVYEVQAFKPDPNRKLPPQRSRAYFVVKDGVVAEASDDPDEVQEVIDAG